MSVAWVKQPEPWDPRQPQGHGVVLHPEQVRSTIEYLRTCIRARKAGYPVSYTTDPEWLVDMAINRRAGWPDDPSHARGSCMPVGASMRYPKRAEGNVVSGCARLAWDLAHRIIVREISVRWLPRRVRERIAHRLYTADDF